MGNNIKIGAGKEENVFVLWNYYEKKCYEIHDKQLYQKSIPFVMKAIPEIKKRMPFRTHW